MVGVVVVDARPPVADHGLALGLEASSDAAEPGQAGEEPVRVEAAGPGHLAGGEQGGQGVERHVLARGAHVQFAVRPAVEGEPGPRAVGVDGDPRELPRHRQVGRRTVNGAVPHHADARGRGPARALGRALVIDAHHERAGVGDAGEEGVEDLVVRLGGAEVVEVVGFGVGEDHDVGLVVHEGAVGLVGLGHEHGVGAAARVGPELQDGAAHREGRVGPGGEHARDEHRGGGGLAVGTAHHDRAARPGEVPEHLRPGDDRDARGPRRDEF